MIYNLNKKKRVFNLFNTIIYTSQWLRLNQKKLFNIKSRVKQKGKSHFLHSNCLLHFFFAKTKKKNNILPLCIHICLNTVIQHSIDLFRVYFQRKKEWNSFGCHTTKLRMSYDILSQLISKCFYFNDYKMKFMLITELTKIIHFQMNVILLIK